MLARMWEGLVPDSKAAEYARLMVEVALPEYQSVVGNLGAWCLQRPSPSGTVFVMLTFWRDLEAIKGFAGEEVTRARYYPFDPDFLVDLPEHVVHFEVAPSVPEFDETGDDGRPLGSPLSRVAWGRGH